MTPEKKHRCGLLFSVIRPILVQEDLEVQGALLEALIEEMLLTLPVAGPMTEEIALKGARSLADDIEDHLRDYFAGKPVGGGRPHH